MIKFRSWDKREETKMDDYWVGTCPFDGGDLYGDSEGHASWCDICGREFVDRVFNGN